MDEAANTCVKKGEMCVCVCLLCTELAGRHVSHWYHRRYAERGPGVLQLPLLPVRALVPFVPLKVGPNQWLPEVAVSGQEEAGLESHLAIPQSGDLTHVL